MSRTAPPGSSVEPDGAIPIRSRGPLVLVVDLDTLAMGKHDDLAQVSAQLRRRPHTSIIYGAGVRSLTSAQTCIDVLKVPSAGVVVADRGASVQAACQHAALDVLDATIGARWPGVYAVRTRVAALGHLLGEHRREYARRMTYFPLRDVSIEDARFAVENVLDDLEVDVRVSDDRGEIDVLPSGTDMASTIMRTLGALELDPYWVVIAGKLIEPRFFDDATYWGVATGDVPAPVRASLVKYSQVHITMVDGPTGVLEGLQALGFLNPQD